MISVAFDFSKLAAKLDGITHAAEEAVRPAAQAGAQVFYDEVKQRVSGMDDAGPGVVTGNLLRSIYQAFADKESDDGRSVYRISWNKKKAPHGHLLERGTSKMAARPFIRPSYDAVQGKALEAADERMREEVNKAIA